MKRILGVISTKRKEVSQNLKEALEATNHLIDATLGDASSCVVFENRANLEEIKYNLRLYVDSWIKSPIERAFNEVEKGNKEKEKADFIDKPMPANPWPKPKQTEKGDLTAKFRQTMNQDSRTE
jgi:hypothetical protein